MTKISLSNKFLLSAEHALALELTPFLLHRDILSDGVDDNLLEFLEDLELTKFIDLSELLLAILF